MSLDAAARGGVPSVFPCQLCSVAVASETVVDEPSRELIDGFDLVAGANDATRDDVGAEAAAVHEWAEESGSGEFLEVGARFG